jgi:predicted GIY-YIG superfamily endonuclease
MSVIVWAFFSVLVLFFLIIFIIFLYKGFIMSNICYCLINHSGRKTYVGATINMNHRLRQHNGEIKGGAKYTTSHSDVWSIAFTVDNFPNYNELLKFEWKLKKCSRKYNTGTPLKNRVLGLIDLINSGKSTKSSMPFSEYQLPLNVNIFNPNIVLLNEQFNININIINN